MKLSSNKLSINTRAIASQVLIKVLHEDQSLNQGLSLIKKEYPNLSPQDAAFIQTLCYGVLREFPKFQFIAKKLLQKPFKLKDEDLLYLIYLGLYQLIDLKTPEHAAIHETVEAVKNLKKNWATGLINAVLRNFLRGKDSLLKEFNQDVLAKSLHPAWLLKALQKSWPNQVNDIIDANNQHPPLSLRVNLKQISREKFLLLLQENQIPENQIPALPIPETTTGVILETPQPITLIPGFEEGFFSVQDGASQLIIPLLNLSPNLRVLDACAAPGGKSAALLEQSFPIDLISLDKSESGIEKVKDNFKRLKLSGNIKVNVGDATKPETWWDKQLFDRILLDAPCSATGIIRRHPDIKFRRQPNDIAKFAAQQLELLTALWPLLKKEGILVYSTCSILPEENEQVIQAFVTFVNRNNSNNGNMRNDAIKILRPSIPIGLPQPLGHQLLPGQNNMDGFYYAVLQK